MKSSKDTNISKACATEGVARASLAADYNERLQSLLGDGYVRRFESKLTSMWFVRLHHMANGNDIVMKADFDQLLLTQRTNRIVVHCCIYSVNGAMRQS